MNFTMQIEQHKNYSYSNRNKFNEGLFFVVEGTLAEKFDWLPSLIYREEMGDYRKYYLHTEHFGPFIQDVPNAMA